MNFAAPLDAARRRAIRLALPLGPWLTQRDQRIAAQASLAVVVALVAASAFPAWMLALSPVLLGVPHVASDVRYLVVRRRLPRAWLSCVAVASVALIVLRAGEAFHYVHLPYDRVEIVIVSAWLVLAAAAGAHVARVWRRFLVALPLVAVGSAVAIANPQASRLVVAHGHNVVAILVWVVLFRRRAKVVLLPLVALAAGLVALLSGVTVPLAARLGTDAAFGQNLYDIALALAPGLEPNLAVRVTLTFVALQAVHYAVWLRLVPQEDVRAEGSPTFAMSARSLVRDFGALALFCLTALTLVVTAAACADVYRTRDLYLSLAAFHAWLELAMLAYFVCAGGVGARGAFRSDPTARSLGSESSARSLGLRPPPSPSAGRPLPRRASSPAG